MRLQFLALLAGATIVAADTTTTLLIPGIATQSIEGKIVGSSGSMTTYVLNCPPGEDPNKCGLPPTGYTVTEGPSSVIMSVQLPYGPQTFQQSCSIRASTYADCVFTAISNGSTNAITTGFTIASIPYGGYMPVHITATETADASASASTGASDSSTTTTSPMHTTLTGTMMSSTPSATSPSTSESSNAAMPMVTGHAPWMMGAAALALAVV